MNSMEELKSIMLRPREELTPLLRFKGHHDINKIAAWWNYVNAMRLNECETIGEGAALARATDLPHFCGRHAKYTENFSIKCFVNRLKQSPKVTKIISGLPEYIEMLWPGDPWKLYIVGSSKRAQNAKAMKQLNVQFGKSVELRYLFSTNDTEQRMLKTVHDAVPGGVPHNIRNDICQDMLCALIAGEISEENLHNEVRRYISDGYKLLPHSREDYPGSFRTETGGDKSADDWKRFYIPPAPTFEEKVTDLHEHWQCGTEPPPTPTDLVSPMSVEKGAETFDEMQKRLRKNRLKDILGETYLENKRHACTSKKRFNSSKLVEEAQARLATRSHIARSYRCQFCGFWHLSSHAKKAAYPVAEVRDA